MCGYVLRRSLDRDIYVGSVIQIAWVQKRRGAVVVVVVDCVCCFAQGGVFLVGY